MAYVLSWIGIGWLAGHLVDGLARIFPSMRGWNCSTLHPRSNRELLELYNKYSYHHVKIVGYNNGIVHFGQGHPGKTVVSTIRCNQVARLRGNVGQFDAGVTLRQAIDVVSQGGKEFHVLPNYSYVSVGTSFYIPIHGSASEYSTLGDTIERSWCMTLLKIASSRPGAMIRNLASTFTIFGVIASCFASSFG